MKATGIIRRIDDLGRIAIPKEIRRLMGVTEGTPIEIFTTEDGVVLKKYNIESTLGDMVSIMEDDLNRIYEDIDQEKAELIRGHIEELKILCS